MPMPSRMDGSVYKPASRGYVPHAAKDQTLPGFRKPPKERKPPVNKMGPRQLRELIRELDDVLARPRSSTSAPDPDIAFKREQALTRLAELEGVPALQSSMANTHIHEVPPPASQSDSGDDSMAVDPPPVSPTRRIATKQRLIDNEWNSPTNSNVASISMAEAALIEQRAHAADAARRLATVERRERRGEAVRSDARSRAEHEARIWAFMGVKPSDSDLEDDSDYDGSDADGDCADPGAWFEDDQDDGRKGQDIVEPDMEDDWLSSVIRVEDPGAARGQWGSVWAGEQAEHADAE